MSRFRRIAITMHVGGFFTFSVLLGASVADQFYKIDAESCNHLDLGDSLNATDIQAVFDEAIDMVRNVLRLMKTPRNLWDSRVADVIRAMIGDWHGSGRAEELMCRIQCFVRDL